MFLKLPIYFITFTLMQKITPINLIPDTKVSELIEQRRGFSLNTCELNIYETRKAVDNFPLIFDGFTITSMLRGTKKVRFKDLISREYVPGNTIIAPAKKELKIDFICTPFDFESLNLIKKLNLSAIKIASSDMTDYPLISEIAKLKKPIILSTGMSNGMEISKTLKIINSKNITILHCVSMYPCDNNKANLNRILSLKKKFKKYTIGYSDHCKNFEASIFALSLGAKVIEKHFTLDKKRVGLDLSLIHI